MKVRRVESRLGEVVCEYDARNRCGTAADVARLCGSYRDEAVEVFVAVLLNGQHRPMGLVEVSRGTLTSSLVHPREVFGPAMRMGAAALIVVHNHPSGDPTPSHEDLQVTKRLIGVGELVGIPLLDHVVLGAGEEYRSIRAQLGRWEAV